MESVLVSCKKGIVYAGKLLNQDYVGTQWVSLKPSETSDVLVHIHKAEIKEMYKQNGEIEKIGEEVQLNDIFYDASNSFILIRVNGGVSFYGREVFPFKIKDTKSKFLLVNEEVNIVVEISEKEVESVYSE